MTNQRSMPDDRFDAFETRFATRIARHAEHGVRPIDAAAIARNAAVAGGGQGRRMGRAGGLARVGWLLAGAVLAAGAIGGAAWAGSHGLLGVATSSPAPTLLAVVPTAEASVPPSVEPTEPPATPVPTEPPTPACHITDLTARVTAWNGAAGNRVATVVLTNDGTVACRIQVLEKPQLVDGDDTVLIDGDVPSHPASITIAAGASVSTMTDDANYCGPDGKAPITVAFVFSGGQQLVATPRTPTDTFGQPDCMGGSAGSITMHPWAP
jgi:hypothetical protein